MEKLTIFMILSMLIGCASYCKTPTQQQKQFENSMHRIDEIFAKENIMCVAKGDQEDGPINVIFRSYVIKGLKLSTVDDARKQIFQLTNRFIHLVNTDPHIKHYLPNSDLSVDNLGYLTADNIQLTINFTPDYQHHYQKPIIDKASCSLGKLRYYYWDPDANKSVVFYEESWDHVVTLIKKN